MVAKPKPSGFVVRMEQENSHVQNPNFNNNSPMRSIPNLISYSPNNNLNPSPSNGNGNDNGNGNGSIQLFFSYYRSSPSNFIQPQALALRYSPFMYNPYLSPPLRFGFSGTPVDWWINRSQSQLGFSRMPDNSEYSGETSRAMNMSGYRPSTVQVTHPAARRINLPVDVVTEILRRLPAKDILRMRSVCKLWNSLTREDQFINKQMNNPPNPDDLGIITLYQSHNPLKFKFFVHCFVNGFHEFNMTDLYEFGEDSFQMSNSCRGLVCVYGWYATYVVNPSIKEVLEVPRTKNRAQASVALAHDETSGKYKLIRLFEHSARGRTGRTGCEIFDLGSYSWRAAPAPDALCSVSYNSVPVVVNGAIYWLANPAPRDETIAISLDIKSESFNVIDEPMDFTHRRNARIFELDGRLCLSTMPDLATHLTIWTLRDDGGEECCRWGIHVIGREKSSGVDYNPFRPVVPVTCRDGKILWQGCCSRYKYYDLKAEEFLDPFHIEHEHSLGQACAYTESLISPAEIQEGNPGRGFEQVPWPI